MPILRDCDLDQMLSILHQLRRTEEPSKFPDKIVMSRITMEWLEHQARYPDQAPSLPADSTLITIYGIPVMVDDSMPPGVWMVLAREGGKLHGS